MNVNLPGFKRRLTTRSLLGRWCGVYWALAARPIVVETLILAPLLGLVRPTYPWGIGSLLETVKWHICDISYRFWSPG